MFVSVYTRDTPGSSSASEAFVRFVHADGSVSQQYALSRGSSAAYLRGSRVTATLSIAAPSASASSPSPPFAAVLVSQDCTGSDPTWDVVCVEVWSGGVRGAPLVFFRRDLNSQREGGGGRVYRGASESRKDGAALGW